MIYIVDLVSELIKNNVCDIFFTIALCYIIYLIILFIVVFADGYYIEIEFETKMNTKTYENIIISLELIVENESNTDGRINLLIDILKELPRKKKFPMKWDELDILIKDNFKSVTSYQLRLMASYFGIYLYEFIEKYNFNHIEIE